MLGDTRWGMINGYFGRACSNHRLHGTQGRSDPDHRPGQRIATTHDEALAFVNAKGVTFHT